MSFLRRFWKWILTVVFGLGIVSAAVISPQETQTIENRIAEIETIQNDEKTLKGDYKQMPKEAIGSTTIEVHEYGGPQGVGYQIIRTDTTETSTRFRSWGVGPESESKSYDYTIPFTPNPVTSTPENL